MKKHHLWAVVGFILLLFGIFGGREAEPWIFISFIFFYFSSPRLKTLLRPRFKIALETLQIWWQDRVMRWHILGTGIFIGVGFFLLLGLPGAVLYTAHKAVAELFWGEGIVVEPQEDTTWPAMILMTILWPIGFVSAYLLLKLRLLANRAHYIKLAFYISFVFLWGMVLTLLAHGFSR